MWQQEKNSANYETGDKLSHTVAFSPDDRFIAFGGRDAKVRILDAANGSVVHVLEAHQDAVRGLCFSPDGAMIASAANDESVRLWDTASGKLLHTYRGHVLEVQSVDISPDGKTIVSGSDDRKIKIWGITTTP